MPTLTDRRTVAANAVEQNVLSGKAQEFLIEPAVLRFAIVAAAVGVFATVIVGDEVVQEDQEVSGVNRFPVDPDDYNIIGAGLPGDRMVVKLRNSTAAGIAVVTSVRVEPA